MKFKERVVPQKQQKESSLAADKRNLKFLKRLLLSTSLATIPLTQVHAQTSDLETSRESLTILEQRIIQYPYNLDYQFEYAKMANTLQEYEKAERAYRLMLRYNPELLRVKLDLALLYVKMQRHNEAKPLLEEVLATNPPESVKENVTQLLAVTNKSLKPHNFSASVSMGWLHDSNANSASSTGNITVFGTSVPLEGTSASQEDAQGFASVSLGHTYRFPTMEGENASYSFASNALYYQTEQANLDTLDLKVAQVKFGPSIYLKKSKTKLGLNGTYSHITLNGEEYLATTTGDVSFDHAYSNKLMLSGQILFEHRHFSNSDTVTTYTERTGNAYQIKGSARYMLTKDDIFQAIVTMRDEEARAQYYANNSVEFSGNYTRILPKDFFANVSTSYKWLEYDGSDALIDSTRVREDNNWKAGLTIGKKFPKNITTSISYQYTNASANIQNYDYDNHRVMTTVGWSY